MALSCFDSVPVRLSTAVKKAAMRIGCVAHKVYKLTYRQRTSAQLMISRLIRLVSVCILLCYHVNVNLVSGSLIVRKLLQKCHIDVVCD